MTKQELIDFDKAVKETYDEGYARCCSEYCPLFSGSIVVQHLLVIVEEQSVNLPLPVSRVEENVIGSSQFSLQQFLDLLHLFVRYFFSFAADCDVHVSSLNSIPVDSVLVRMTRSFHALLSSSGMSLQSSYLHIVILLQFSQKSVKRNSNFRRP